MRRKAILIMAGGTGGHIYPALAVAERLRRRPSGEDGGASLYWLGTRRGLEAKLAPAHGIELFTLGVGGLRGKGRLRALRSPPILLLSLCRAMCLLLRLKPAAALGMGGYASGPGALAAWLLRVPLYIHEQNRRAGLTNTMLAPLARVVFQGFPDTFPKRRGAITSGNPVRRAVCDLPAPRRRMAGRGEALRVLILGGSQGARALNRLTPRALSALAADRAVEVWHQCGAAHREDTAREIAALGFSDRNAYRLDAFIDDMAAAYAWADVAVCRAGALTIAELCAAGLGAVLIPFPHAVDDHQTLNARYMSDAGAAVLCPEAGLDAAGLRAVLADLLRDRQALLEMAENSRKLARPDAARLIAAYCLGETP